MEYLLYIDFLLVYVQGMKEGDSPCGLPVTTDFHVYISVYMCKEGRQAGDNPCGLLIVVAQLSIVSSFLQPCGLQPAGLPVPHRLPEVCPSSCLLHWWCHPAASSSDALFSFCHQSFSASGTFPMTSLFPSSDQNTGASASVVLMSIQD